MALVLLLLAVVSAGPGPELRILGPCSARAKGATTVAGGPADVGEAGPGLELRLLGPCSARATGAVTAAGGPAAVALGEAHSKVAEMVLLQLPFGCRCGRCCCCCCCRSF
jgi:hypothetical protein